MKKKKFWFGLFAAVSVSAVAVMAAGCNPIEDIKTAINQARCEHEWNDGEIIKESTCTEKGELTKTCTLCDKVETVELDLVAHIPVYVDAVAPTCNETGLTDGTVCAVCDNFVSGFQELPALGHIVEMDYGHKATCLENGLSDGAHCTRCDEVLKEQAIIVATGHNLVTLDAIAPTCTEEGLTQGVVCGNCHCVFVEQEPVSTIKHVDEDEDSLCDGCGATVVPTMNMREVVLEEGDLVGDSWFRFYVIPVEQNYMQSGIDSVTGFITQNGGQFGYNTERAGVFTSNMNIQSYEGDIIVIESSERLENGQPVYYDIYVPMGLTYVDCDGYGGTITETSTVISTANTAGKALVYRLV